MLLLSLNDDYYCKCTMYDTAGSNKSIEKVVTDPTNIIIINGS